MGFSERYRAEYETVLKRYYEHAGEYPGNPCKDKCSRRTMLNSTSEIRGTWVLVDDVGRQLAQTDESGQLIINSDSHRQIQNEKMKMWLGFAFFGFLGVASIISNLGGAGSRPHRSHTKTRESRNQDNYEYHRDEIELDTEQMEAHRKAREEVWREGPQGHSRYENF